MRRRVRVFRFATGKLRRSYDESPEAASELQRNGGDALKLDPIGELLLQIDVKEQLRTFVDDIPCDIR